MNAITFLRAETDAILRKNATAHGFVAGATHFRDVWARDALFACWGALRAGMYDEVRRTLQTLGQQVRNGQVPLRYGRQSMRCVFLGLPTTIGPVYHNDKTNHAALDPNSLFLITLDRVHTVHTRPRSI